MSFNRNEYLYLGRKFPKVISTEDSLNKMFSVLITFLVLLDSLAY